MVFAACLAGATWVSLLLRQNANWDLQNYHYYNPWAWLGGRNFTWDIAAAQLQTYHNALRDVPFYATVAAGWPPRAIAAALAIPTGVAWYFLAKLRWFTVTAPSIESHALVLLASDGAMAYVLPSLPADAQFAGIDNSINRPGFATRLNESIARKVREHGGSLHALAYPAATGDQASRSLGLVRNEENCAKITTNMPSSPLSLCRLVRLPATTP